MTDPTRTHVGPTRSRSVLARIYVGSIQIQDGPNTESMSDRSDPYRFSRESMSVQYKSRTDPSPNPYRAAPIHNGSRASRIRLNTNPERIQPEPMSDRSDPDRFSHESMSGQYKSRADQVRTHIGPIRSRTVLTRIHFGPRANPERTHAESISDRSDPYRCRTNPFRSNTTPERTHDESISGRSYPDRFSHESTSGQNKSITDGFWVLGLGLGLGFGFGFWV